MAGNDRTQMFLENMVGDAIVRGARIIWVPNEIYGTVSQTENGRILAQMDNGESLQFGVDTDAIRRDVLQPFDRVRETSTGRVGLVMRPVDGQVMPTWRVAFTDGESNVLEMALRRDLGHDPEQLVRNNSFGRALDFNLRCVAEDLWTRHFHDELVSLAHSRVDVKAHQVSVVHRVINHYPHRFLLCDEVGLGKTIEAAMIVKELRARGLAKRVLVIVPPGLQRQWQFELKTKFNESFAIITRATYEYLKSTGAPNPWAAEDSVITSQSWASWTPERQAELATVSWDLIIVDEAHHARKQRWGGKETRTKLFTLVNRLVGSNEFARRGALFLTATPLQLQKHELYSLVEMLDPILFSSESDFDRHEDEIAHLNLLADRIAGQGATGRNTPEIVERDAVEVAETLVRPVREVRELLLSDRHLLVEEIKSKHRLSEVLIRNRRIKVGGFQPRTAFRWKVKLTPTEAALQQAISDLVTEGIGRARQSNQNALYFLMVTWQKLAASSTTALKKSLSRRIEKLRSGVSSGETADNAEEMLEEDREAAEVIESLPVQILDELKMIAPIADRLGEIKVDSKARVLLENLNQIVEDDRNAKVLIFTEFRDTQTMLSDLLEEQGWSVHLFHGQMSVEQKDRSVERFRTMGGPQFLVSTEAGGEGRNFQFCHLLVNYDLPWNPMKVEQRIGRIDRLGQEFPVTVFNFEVEGTIEERVLDVLDRRIQLFEKSVGGLDPILGETENDIRKALRLTAAERDRRLEALAGEIEAKVNEARRAERQLQDLILDTKSYSAEIAQIAKQTDASVSQSEFEKFIVWLLKDGDAYVEEPDPNGVREVTFHDPFTAERPDLFIESRRKRITLSPHSQIDSEFIEFFGFGHPIVDAHVEKVMSKGATNSTAVRKFKASALNVFQPGWQFVWKITVSGVDRHETLKSLFMSDTGDFNETIGDLLLEKSRHFDFEDTESIPGYGGFERGLEASKIRISEIQQGMVDDAIRQAEERESIERVRIERLVQVKRLAALDRVQSCELTLSRLESSSDSQVRQAIPMWKANYERALAEVELVDQDRVRMLTELNRRKAVSAENRLIGIARIEVE